jgi:hypothetical protein
MRHLSTTDFLNVCILRAQLSSTISHYQTWSLESTKWLRDLLGKLRRPRGGPGGGAAGIDWYIIQ